MKLTNNIGVTFLGQLLTVAVMVVSIPVYVSTLSPDKFGIVSLFILAQSLFATFDFGLSATLNRDLAKVPVARPSDRPRLVRTFESACWSITIISIIISVVITNHLSIKPLPQIIPLFENSFGLLFFSASVALQWPINLYSGALRGCHQHIPLIKINAAFSTIRCFGIIIILLYGSTALEVFFFWNAVVSLLYLSALRRTLWRTFGNPVADIHFDLSLILRSRRFMFSLAGISLLTLGLTHWDRLVLIGTISLSAFGHYTIAVTAAAGVAAVTMPYFNVCFPHFSSLIAKGDHEKAIAEYHDACASVAAIIGAIGSILVFFSAQIVMVWTNDQLVAHESGRIISVLAIAAVLNGVLIVPYAMQLAHGLTQLTLIQNLISLAIVIPATVYLAGYYGAIGVAWIGVGLNLAFILISIPLMHRSILNGELFQWYGKDTFRPLFFSFLTSGLASYFSFKVWGNTPPHWFLALVVMSACAVCAINAPHVRVQLIGMWSIVRARK